ncbi:carbon monoxide dehydrogenase [Streptomyces sp. NPDC008159]|uniref:carbon monoxide dehydrogenase n=1 Tax=Streptomyces sp. NPDC008159 TaxID=3364817 RepID=UPI0036E54EEA
MEHEVFVPVHVDRLREALSDPERVARAVPGLQHDAGTPPVAGRLKVRAAGHTITYRGALRVSGADDGSYVVEGDATEVRGSGTVRLALTIRLTSTPEGTTLHFTGTATADGRITELPTDAVTTATSRLLTRFAEKLGKTATEAERDGKDPATEDAKTTPVTAGDDDRDDAGTGEGGDAETRAADTGAGADEEDDSDVGAGVGEVPPASVFEAEVPPPSPDPFTEDDFVAGGEPPAEAAHARRTMIGRSAEEVDHAPPRGRYAPVPAPENGSVGTAALRWAAPAAAVAVASAVIVARALRRRR